MGNNTPNLEDHPPNDEMFLYTANHFLKIHENPSTTFENCCWENVS